MQNKIKIVAVSVGEPQNNVRRFLEERGITFQVAHDEKEAVFQNLGIRGIPLLFAE